MQTQVPWARMGGCWRVVCSGCEHEGARKVQCDLESHDLLATRSRSPPLMWGSRPRASGVAVRTREGVASIPAQGRCCQEGSWERQGPRDPPSPTY